MIFIEKMQGFDEAIQQFQYEGLPLVSGNLTDLLQDEKTGEYFGLIKGPRGIMDENILHDLHHRGITHISYIGRHVRNILGGDLVMANEGGGLVSIQLDNSEIMVMSIEHSPLSSAVAAYILGLSDLAVSNGLDLIKDLTIPEGNTFLVRNGHHFINSQLTNTETFEGLNILSIGAGDIGRKVIDGFNYYSANVGYVSISPKPVNGNFYPSFDVIDKKSPIDILSVHLPPNIKFPIGEYESINIFIHTASATNIDEAEILKALIEGRIKIAIIDVFSKEGVNFSNCFLNPIFNEYENTESLNRKLILNKLIRDGRLILTPHIAYNEATMVRETLKMAIGNILKYK